MRVITSKRNEGRTTKLIEEWKKTGGILIASHDFGDLRLEASKHPNCYFLTYSQVKQGYLRGHAADYIYVDDIDLCLYTLIGLNGATLIGTIDKNCLEPLNREVRQDDVCTAYLCPECNAAIDYVEKRTLVTTTRVERINLKKGANN